MRDGELQALLWQRAREPDAGAWALPGGYLEPGETLEESIRRHLAAKVDVRELSHLEQLGTWSDPRPPSATSGSSRRRTSASSRTDVDPAVPADTAGTRSTRLPRMAFDHGGDRPRRPRAPAREALVHEPRLRARAADVHDLGAARALHGRARHEVSATNLQRVLLRRELLEDTGERRAPGPHGGRPATVFRFRSRELEITDQFAVLRPPAPTLSG